jgi:outer membrane lipoprotein-sorting protein
MHKFQSIFIYILFLTCSFPFSSHAQEMYHPLKDVSRLKQEADKMAATTQTIESDFLQVKSLSMLSEKITSKGHFYFKKENRLRWEYTSPYEYLMVVNGNKVMIRDEKKTMHYDLNANKTFREINEILLACISGNIFNSDKFKIDYFESDADYKIELFPREKPLNETIKKFILYFDKSITYVTRVELIESSGDSTRISFTGKKLNEVINDEKFSVSN